MGAVGPNHIGVMINGRWSVYDKTGDLQGSGQSLDNFWVSAGVSPSGCFSFDPRILYDKHSGRWFAASVDNARGPNNFLVAVSDNSDPTAGWTGFSIDSDSDETHWADFPMLGMNGDVVVVQANMFAIESGSAEPTTLVIPKGDLTMATPSVANATLFEETSSTNHPGFSAQPVVDLDSGSLATADAFFVERRLFTCLEHWRHTHLANARNVWWFHYSH